MTTINSNYRGEIRKLFLVYPGDPNSVDDKNLPLILLELARKLSSHTQIIVWCNSEEGQKELLDLLEQQGIKCSSELNHSFARCVILAPKIASSTSYVSFVRDPFLVWSGKNSDNSVITEHYDQLNNQELAELLEELEVSFKKEVEDWFVFNGGDVLVGDDYVLLSGNSFAKMIEIHGGTVEHGKEALKKIFKKNKVIVLGYNKDIEHKLLTIFDRSSWIDKDDSYENPTAHSMKVEKPSDDTWHLDMFITLTGYIDSDGKEVVFVGLPIKLNGETVKEKDEAYIQPIIKDLENNDFSVRRIPMPMMSKYRKPDRARYWLHYNNCLQEVWKGQSVQEIKKVWIPSFAFGQTDPRIQAFDIITCAEWEKIGYQAQLIEASFHDYSRRRGALHCIAVELYRQQ